MTDKLKKMGYILCIGTILVFLGSIGIYSSNAGLDDIWKTILIFVLSLFLGVLSYVSNKSFGLKKFDDFILSVSFVTFTWAYMSIGKFALFGEWFSITGEGLYIFLASIFVLVCILSVLMHVKTKVFGFLEFSYIALIIAIYYIVLHFTDSSYIAAIAFAILILISNIYSLKDSKYSIFTIVTFLSIIVCPFVLFDNISRDASNIFSYFPFIYCLISIFSICVIGYKYKDSNNNIATTIFGFVTFILLLISIYSITSNDSIAMMIFAFVVTIYNTCVSIFKLYRVKSVSILNLVFMNILYFISIFGYNETTFSLLIFAIIVIGSIINSFVFKNEYNYEKYLLPYKGFIASSFLLGHIGEVLLHYNMLYNFIIINVIAIIILLFAKARYLKIDMVIFVCISLLLILCCDDMTLVPFIFSVITIAFDYFSVYILSKNKNDKSLNRVFFIIMLIYSLLLVLVSDLSSYKFLIMTVFYSVLFVLEYKDKLLSGFSLAALVGSLLLFTASIDNNKLILDNIIVFAGLFAFGYSIISDEKNRELYFNISMIIFIVLSILSTNGSNYYFNEYADLLSYTVCILIESVFLLIYSIMKNYKVLYNATLVTSGICILRLLFTIEGVPTAVVITFTGIIIILVILVMIRNYMKYEQEKDLAKEKADKKVVKEFINKNVNKGATNYCGQCGAVVNKKSKYCGNCGKEIKREIRFCGQCGAKLNGKFEYCPECGDKIKK